MIVKICQYIDEAILKNIIYIYIHVFGGGYTLFTNIRMEGSCSSILDGIYLHLYRPNQIFNKNVIYYRCIDDVLHVTCIGFTEDVNLDFYPDSLKLKLFFL